MATMNSLTDIWSVVMDSLSQELTQTAINTWFSDCTPIEINNNTLIVHTTSDFKRSIIQARFEKTICAKLYDLFSCPFELVVLAGDDELLEYRDMFDSSYAAFYHPWIQIFDPLSKKNIIAPPSGSVVGIYARTDTNIGVHKAPANEVVRSCTGLASSYNTAEQDLLNPKGINLIRSFPGRGIRVWGARTASSNATWKYVNVRRLFIYLEESIRANTNWVVFEPNTEALWGRVKRTVEMFLASTWRSGALAGTSPSEAFFVDIGRNTMTQDDIDNGRLICVIGVAPVKPAEFVVFKIGQYTSESNG